MSIFGPKYDFRENNLYFFWPSHANTDMNYNEENFRNFVEDIKLRID